MAKHLLDEIGSESYFSGVIDFSQLDSEGRDVECHVVASLIIYWSKISNPECDMSVISNIVPVWIECHTIVDMEEKINDFDMSELNHCICAWD
ncbi:MAG: hypothetical protein SNG10_03745 [Rikenellaceae bacterium]